MKKPDKRAPTGKEIRYRLRRLCRRSRMPNPADLSPDWAVIDAEKWQKIMRLAGFP